MDVAPWCYKWDWTGLGRVVLKTATTKNNQDKLKLALLFNLEYEYKT